MRRTPAELDGQREKFDWDDANRYEWVISGRGARRRTGFWKFLYFAGPIIGPGLIIPALAFFWTAVFFLFVSDAYKFRIGMTIVVLLMGLSLYLLLRVRWGPTTKRAKAKSDLDELLTTSVGIIACVISKAMAGGFKGGVESLWQWLLFLLQEAMRVATADIPDIFNYRLTNIEANSWYARLGLVIFRALIAYGLISSVIAFYQRRFQRQPFTGTVRECFRNCQYLLDRDTLQLKREGVIITLTHPEQPVAMLDFLEALDERDHRDELANKRASSGNSQVK